MVLWWFMLVFDDLWLFIIAFSMMTATTYVTNNTCNKCLFIVSDSSSINILALPCYGFFSPAFIVEPTPDRVTNKPYSPIVSYSLVIEYMSSPITSVLSPVFSCFLLMFDVTNDHQKKNTPLTTTGRPRRRNRRQRADDGAHPGAHVGQRGIVENHLWSEETPRKKQFIRDLWMQLLDKQQDQQVLYFITI